MKPQARKAECPPPTPGFPSAQLKKTAVFFLMRPECIKAAFKLDSAIPNLHEGRRAKILLQEEVNGLRKTKTLRNFGPDVSITHTLSVRCILKQNQAVSTLT